MKKHLSLLILILVTAAALLIAAMFLIPDRVERAWRQAGLPNAPLARLEALAGQVTAPQETRLYGTLESRAITAMSELNGRAQAVLVDNGESVTAGQPLIRLNPTDVQAQIAAAEEAVTAAGAARDAVAAPPDITVQALADRAVAAAETDVSNAQRSLEQARDMLENPLALDAQINQTAALIPIAKANVDASAAAIKQAEVLIADAKTDGSRQGKYKVRTLEEQKAAAEEEKNAAQARLDGLYRTLAKLKAMRADPIALEAAVHQAESQVKLAQAALKVAKAQRDAQIAPPQPEAVAVAEADVQKAQAALAMARWQADRLVITAPASGLVQSKLIETGEIVQPGLPLLRISDSQKIEVWAYVAQQDLNQVHLNDRLPVEVLAIPGKQFTGEVFFIASEAQFRPNNVLNPDDRSDMVFLIKLHLDNEDDEFKPGMPADVILP